MEDYFSQKFLAIAQSSIHFLQHNINISSIYNVTNACDVHVYQFKARVHVTYWIDHHAHSDLKEISSDVKEIMAHNISVQTTAQMYDTCTCTIIHVHKIIITQSMKSERLKTFSPLEQEMRWCYKLQSVLEL